MTSHTYDPTQPGELFEQLESVPFVVECKACATKVYGTQRSMCRHAETEQEVNGKKTTCRGFWESNFPERFG